ncbi:MAG: histidine phosphatase family protein [Geminicoccaceae bacterium]
MLELLLLRHAKSRWDQSHIDDHARDLSARGEAAAPMMGAWLLSRGLVPDLVLCSTARRALRTWQLAAARLDPVPETVTCDELYLAEPPRMLDVVRRRGGTVRRLMLVGHNPGMHVFANRLVAAGPTAERARLAEKFPTAGLALIRFAIMDWADLQPGTGELLGFWRPRDLAAGGA